MRGSRAVATLAALLILAPVLLGGALGTSEAPASPWGSFLRYQDRFHGEHVSTALVDGNLTPILAGEGGGVLLAALEGANLTKAEVHPHGRVAFGGDAIRLTVHDTPYRTLIARANDTQTVHLALPPGGSAVVDEGRARLAVGDRVGILRVGGHASVLPADDGLDVHLGNGSHLALAWYGADDPLADLAHQGLHVADVRSTTQSHTAWIPNEAHAPGRPTHNGTVWNVTLPPTTEATLFTVTVAGLLQGMPRVILDDEDLPAAPVTNLTRDAPAAHAVLTTDPVSIAVLIPPGPAARNLILLLDGEPPRVASSSLARVTLDAATLHVRLHEPAALQALASPSEGGDASTASVKEAARNVRVEFTNLTHSTTYNTILHVRDALGNEAILRGPSFRTLQPPTPQDPVLLQLHPARGGDLHPGEAVAADYHDPTGTLDPAHHVTLLIDGVNVTANATINTTSLRYLPPDDLAAGKHRAELRLRNADGGEAHALWTFRVPTPEPPPARGAPALALPAALGVLAGAVLLARRSFRK